MNVLLYVAAVVVAFIVGWIASYLVYNKAFEAQSDIIEDQARRIAVLEDACGQQEVALKIMLGIEQEQGYGHGV